jgi:hypothetical protein
MNTLEKNAIKVVAKVSPWLAPLPSAYFVARSAMAHLALPLPVAVVVAAIIETLGLATVHTALWAFDWNAHKRKTDPSAPVILAIVLGAVYVVATLGLVVFLEVWPWLATYAPALFPALAVVGAVNLALIAQQENREAAVKAQKAEARERRRARQVSWTPSKTVSRTTASGTSETVHVSAQQVSSLASVNSSRQERRAQLLDAMLNIYRDDPEAGPTAIARQLSIGRSTVYAYLADLEDAGRITRNNGNGVEVLERG